MKYLILGSSGQIGTALVKYLKNTNNEVLEFDIVNSKLQDLRLHNNVLLEDMIRQSDFVYFLAFDVGGSRYLNKYQETFVFLHNNITLMKNTFELLKKYNKPFIFASSQMSNMKHSIYGVAKSIGEEYTKLTDGLVVKFWNIYGIEENSEKSHVITDFIIKAKQTGIIDMLSNGSELRQFLHVNDCSECLYILSQKYQNLDKTKKYHITSFQWNSILEIAEIVASNFENIKIQIGKGTDLTQRDSKNEADKYILKFWAPTIDINEGIKRVIDEIKFIYNN